MWSRYGSYPAAVKFYNDASIAIIRQIEVEQLSLGLTIILTATAMYREVLKDKCQRLFSLSPRDIHEATNSSSIWITIRSPGSFNKVMELLRHFDKSKKELTDDLITELHQLYASHYEHRKFIKHIIPTPYVAEKQVNPERQQSQDLTNCMYRGFRVNSLPSKEIAELLVQGDNPNQVSHRRLPVVTTLLDLVVFHLQYGNINEQMGKEIVIIFSWLIFYGADFLRCEYREGIDSIHSAYEYGYENKSSSAIITQCFDVMTSAIHYKSIQDALKKPSKSKQQVRSVEVFRSGNEIVTIDMRFYHHFSVQSILMRMSDLSQKSKEDCYPLFKKYFSKPNKDEASIREEFDEVFEDDETVLINFIYTTDNGIKKLSGFNVFEVVCVDGEVKWHNWYTAMEPECRGPLIAIFAHGFEQASQLACDTDGYFNPLESNALSVMGVGDKMIAAPKYRSTHTNIKVSKIHSKLKTYREGVTIVQDGLKYCVKVDDSVVVNNKNKKPSHFMQTMFDSYYKSENEEAIAYYSVADQSVMQFHACAYELGIDTKYFLKRVAFFLTPFLNIATGNKCLPIGLDFCSRYCDALHLFFLNQRKPSKQNLEFLSPQIRAKL